MPQMQKKYSLEASIDAMRKFPDLVLGNPQLIPVLERNFYYQIEEKPEYLLENWEKDIPQRFYLMAWIVKGVQTYIKEHDLVGMLIVLDLKGNDKKALEETVDAILANATPVEKEFYDKAVIRSKKHK